MALKFGAKMRTPAMQSGLTTQPMTLREIFPPPTLLWISEKVRSEKSTVLVVVDEAPMPPRHNIDDGRTGIAKDVCAGSDHAAKLLSLIIG
jgi:hypothetical protein